MKVETEYQRLFSMSSALRSPECTPLEPFRQQRSWHSPISCKTLTLCMKERQHLFSPGPLSPPMVAFNIDVLCCEFTKSLRNIVPGYTQVPWSNCSSRGVIPFLNIRVALGTSTSSNRINVIESMLHHAILEHFPAFFSWSCFWASS